MQPSVPESSGQAFQRYRPANCVTALAVIAGRESAYLRDLFGEAGWVLIEAGGCLEAVAALRRRSVDVVICERAVDDGDWRLLLRAVQALSSSPALIVTTPLADEYLWAEVLNEGGFDVLSQPLDREETFRVISAAMRRGENERSHNGVQVPRILTASA